MNLNPASDLGEVELRVDAVEDRDKLNSFPYLDADGVPAKAYRSMIDMFRASKDIAGHLRSEPDLKGVTRVIKRRRGSEREFPPGYYSGTGSVIVVLYPGFRYWRFNAGTGSLEELSGRVSCNPDEATQLVATTSANYA
jgi:hypothetical protein